MEIAQKTCIGWKHILNRRSGVSRPHHFSAMLVGKQSTFSTENGQ
jgi:hypothetical protein